MAFSHSPKIATDGLVFYYDTGNGKSYKGEPTTNILNNTITAQGNGATLGEDSFGTYIQLPNITSGYSRFQLPSIPVSSNDIYTWSFELYTTETFTTGYSWDTNEYSDQYPSSNDLSRLTYTHSSPSTIPAGEWTPFSLTVTMKDGLTGAYTYDFFRFFFPTFQNKKVYYRNMQFEFKDHKTQYAGQGGSRSATEGLLDLTKNSTLDISGLSFNSSAEFSFDGTDDRLLLDHPNISSSAGSIEAVVKRLSDTTNAFVAARVAGSTNRYYLRQVGPSGLDAVRGNPLASAAFDATELNTYYHVVMAWDSNTVYAYTNGVLSNQATYTNPGTDLDYLDIGTGPGEYLDMELPVFKMYSKTLTATEVQQNYNAIKNRFGI